MALAPLHKNEVGPQSRSSHESSDSLAPELQVANSFVQDQLDPIAVVGFSIKFPQEATSSEALWSMLLEKRCAMTEWPSERANLDAFYHPDKNRNDTVTKLSQTPEESFVFRILFLRSDSLSLPV